MDTPEFHHDHDDLVVALARQIVARERRYILNKLNAARKYHLWSLGHWQRKLDALDARIAIIGQPEPIWLSFNRGVAAGLAELVAEPV